MAIKRLEVHNFKSFKDLKMQFGPFNVVVGANASGKSNFVQVFKFLNDIRSYGLENAISIQGGAEYLTNRRLGLAEPFSVRIVSDCDFKVVRSAAEGGHGPLIGVNPTRADYHFSIQFTSGTPGFRIVEDSLVYDCIFDSLQDVGKPDLKVLGRIASGHISFLGAGRDMKCTIDPPSVPLDPDVMLEEYIDPELLRNALVMEAMWVLPSEMYAYTFDEVAVYDIDPRLAKRATPITGKVRLAEDGSNLAIVLRKILGRPTSRRKFFNLLKQLLPFVADFKSVIFTDKSQFFKLSESYLENDYLPASLVSDGTIATIASIVAMHFETVDVAVFEEPERNIHPHLASRLVDMMKDASTKKQVIVTTHNPEIVKHTSLKDLFLISRDKSGFSNISKPAQKRGVKAFLEQGLGMEDLHVQDLLGA